MKVNVCFPPCDPNRETSTLAIVSSVCLLNPQVPFISLSNLEKMGEKKKNLSEQELKGTCVWTVYNF